MKIEALYSQGTSPYREDGLVVAKCHFGVIDGVSAPYCREHPMRNFNGMSGGEMVARLCEQVAYAASSDLDVIDLILECNEAVAEEQRKSGLSLDDAGELAGASFAFAHVAEDRVRILQSGDCMAVVERKKWGEIVASPNQVWRHDRDMQAEIERLQRKAAQELFGLELEKVPGDKRGPVRNEMWNRFYHTFKEARRQDANNPNSTRGHGLLNGQPKIRDFFWEKGFWRNYVSTIILVSDGMVPWSFGRDMNKYQMSCRVLEEFKLHGLAGLLLWARGIEEKTAATSYIDHAEATAIALDFNDEK